MFGPQFAPPDNVIRTGFDIVLAGTTVPHANQASAFSAWVPTFKSGDPRAELQALSGALFGVAWSWPLFERWFAIFSRAPEWPTMWQRALEYRDAPKNPDASPAFMLPLLQQTVTSTIYRLREIGQAREIDEPVYGMLTVMDGSGSAGELDAAQAAWPAIAAGDLSRLPPFFPGDRTHFGLHTQRSLGRWIRQTAPEWIRANPPSRAVFPLD